MSAAANILEVSGEREGTRRSVLLLLGTYNVQVHAGVVRHACERGWHLNADMARIPVVPTNWRGDGIVAGLGEWEAPLEFVRKMQKAGVPVVDVYRMRPEIELPRVSGDHEAVGRQAAEHFLEGSWRNFAWFSRVEHAVARMRRESFFAALAERGHEARHLGKELRFSLEGYDADKLARALGEELRAGPKPEAVFAFNDFDAAFLLDVCHREGLRVPADVALLGVDDNPLVVKSVQPALSSVRLDFERIGYEAAGLLGRLMAGETVPEAPVWIVPEGVAARASTDVIATGNAVVGKVLEVMRARLQESLGVDDFARAAGVSRRTLETLFQRELGEGVHRTLLKLRLRQARKSLEQGNETVEAIALEAGFCHAPHLYREFKRWTGKTPSQWRAERLEKGRTSRGVLKPKN